MSVPGAFCVKRVTPGAWSDRLLALFFEWWFAQLRDCLPYALRNGSTLERNVRVVDATVKNVVSFGVRHNGTETTEASLPSALLDLQLIPDFMKNKASAHPVILRLASTDVLQNTITYPVRAEANLEQIISLDMERQMPYRSSEVYWRYDIVARNRNWIRVCVSIVPICRVRVLLKSLSQFHIEPASIAVDTVMGPCSIRLSDPLQRGTVGGIGQKHVAYIGAGLLAFVLATPFIHQAASINRSTRELISLESKMLEFDALRSHLIRSSSAAGTVVAETDQVGSVLDALAILTSTLSSNTYLTEFSMTNRTMIFSGLSDSAPGLITSLSAQPRLRDVIFVAPVSRATENGDNDTFTISAELTK
jgi:hypothetical protein